MNVTAHRLRSVVKALKRHVQIHTGLLRELDSRTLHAGTRGIATEPFWYQWVFSRRLQSGWYMLHVSGSRTTLGHDFRIRLPNQSLVHLQIGAKSVTKRLVYIPEATVSVDLAIVPDLSTGPVPAEQFNVSLVRVSSRFSQTRMRRKLATSNGVTGRRYALEPSARKISTAEMLRDYTRLMQRHVNRVEYSEWLENHAAQNMTEVARSNQASNSIGAEQPADQGVGSQIVFALLGDEQAPLNQQADLELESSWSLQKHQVLDGPDAITRVLQHAQSASSGYIALVGSGLRINPGVVGALNRAIADNPQASLFYSDHDVEQPNGKRGSPAFKPGWNPELLLAGNYVGNFLVVTVDLYRRLGGLNQEFETSMFYDFLLRADARLTTHDVVRIPRMLFSRTHTASQSRTGMTSGKSDSSALKAYLARQSLPAVVKPGLLDNFMRVEWQLPAMAPAIDIIIPTRDRVDLLRCCVDSILAQTHYANYRITVVDNGSVEADTQSYYDELQQEPRFNLVRYPGEFNYSAINNYAVAETRGDVVVLLNNDTEIIDGDWLTHLVAQSIRPEVGCVGAKLYYSSGLIQHAGVILGIRGVAGHAHRFYPRDADGHCGRLKVAQNVSAVTAACLAVRREVFTEVGGLDEVNLKVAYNDVDFCLRVLEAGYRNVWTPHVELYHHESVSRGTDDTAKKARRFQQEYDYMIARWHTDTMSDPSYNPNLALDQEDFWLAA